MKKIAFLLLFAGLIGSLGCSAATESANEEIESTEISEQAASSCRLKCTKCPPNTVCTQTCERIGNCGGECNVIAMCAPGYVWDEHACACEPVTACGSSVCGASEVCCNESCGICTPPGGVCTQQVCTSPTR